MENDLIGPMEVLKELLSNHWGWFLGGLALLALVSYLQRTRVRP